MKKVEWRSIEASILSTCEKDLLMVEVSRMVFTVADCVRYFFNSVVTKREFIELKKIAVRGPKKKHFKRF